MSTPFAQLQAEVAAIAGIDNTDEATNAARFTKAGLRAISRAGAWEWLHAFYSTGLTNTAGDYDLALPSDLYRLDTRSIRTGGRETYLPWRQVAWIDDYLGPDWKDSGIDNGTPEWSSRVGNDLWLARKPSQAWVDDNPKTYFYYWRSEPASGNLYLPDEYVDVAVQAALCYAYLEGDDPRSESQLNKWRNHFLEEMRGAKLNMNDGDQVLPPDWMHFSDDGYDGGGGRYSY